MKQKPIGIVEGGGSFAEVVLLRPSYLKSKALKEELLETACSTWHVFLNEGSQILGLIHLPKAASAPTSLYKTFVPCEFQGKETNELIDAALKRGSFSSTESELINRDFCGGKICSCSLDLLAKKNRPLLGVTKEIYVSEFCSTDDNFNDCVVSK